MNNTIVLNSFRFIGLVLLQVLLFNNIYFLGFINPTIYIAFIFLYPLKKDRGSFLFLSFLIGLIVDIFTNSGGINAAASLFIAYIRISILNFVLQKSDYDYILFRLKSLVTPKLSLYIFILTFIHQLIVNYLEVLNFNTFTSVLYKAFLSSFFSSIILFFSIVLFAKKK